VLYERPEKYVEKIKQENGNYRIIRSEIIGVLNV